MVSKCFKKKERNITLYYNFRTRSVLFTDGFNTSARFCASFYRGLELFFPSWKNILKNKGGGGRSSSL